MNNQLQVLKSLKKFDMTYLSKDLQRYSVLIRDVQKAYHIEGGVINFLEENPEYFERFLRMYYFHLKCFAIDNKEGPAQLHHQQEKRRMRLSGCTKQDIDRVNKQYKKEVVGYFDMLRAELERARAGDY